MYYMNITLYHIILSVCYPQFHVTAVGGERITQGYGGPPVFLLKYGNLHVLVNLHATAKQGNCICLCTVPGWLLDLTKTKDSQTPGAELLWRLNFALWGILFMSYKC